MRRSVAVTALLLAAAASAVAADGPEQAARKAAESWLQLVDQGQYQKSWEQAASNFKNAVSSSQWEQAARATRAPLGGLVSRKLRSQKYTEQLPGAPDGKYVVLQFDSVFEHKAQAVETVVPMLDKDGAWRVSGYFIK
jgi:opacity protein-like surface antigen